LHGVLLADRGTAKGTYQPYGNLLPQQVPACPESVWAGICGDRSLLSEVPVSMER
jgi:hypothetical protein